MTAALDSAFAQLNKSKAKGLPGRALVLATKKPGAKWSGVQENGDPWELVKNSDDSYNVMCN